MAKTDEKTKSIVEAPVYVSPMRYPKDKLLESKQYKNRQDALSFLLTDGETYTLQQVEKLLADFLKGKVK